MLIDKLLSMVRKQAKNDHNMSRWIHMPQHSEKYQYYKMLCGFETFAYEKRGEFRSRTALKSHVNPMEATISLATKVIQSFANNGTVTLSPASDLTSCMLPESKNKYYHDINTIGMSSEST